MGLERIIEKYKSFTPLNQFLIKGAFLYMIWRIFRKFTFIYDMNGPIIKAWGNLYVNIADFFLRLIGCHADKDLQYNYLCLPGGEGVIVEFDCMAFGIMALFAIFVIAYPGTVKVKGWFIPLGLVIIFFINSIRIAALALVVHYIPQYMDLFHHFIFQAIYYLIVIQMWVFWQKKLEPSCNKVIH